MHLRRRSQGSVAKPDVKFKFVLRLAVPAKEEYAVSILKRSYKEVLP